MASSSERRLSEDLSELHARYKRIMLHRNSSRISARRSTSRYKVTLVGSMASGVTVQGSDGDELVEPRNILINESSLQYRDGIPCYVRIPNEGLTGVVPGVILGDEGYILADPVRGLADEIFGSTLSCDGLTKVGKINMADKVPTDIVPQLRISTLPRTARSFATRDRLWPSSYIIALVCTGEFHLAARPSPSNPDPKHDFCLSFSKAEVVLLSTMSANQRLCVKLMKAIENIIDFGRGTLTSYHLKTSTFWHLEKTDARLWENDILIVGVLQRLDRYLNDRFLPHYFVPEMNLLIGVAKTDLIYIRRRLWAFLGLCFIIDHVAGMTSPSRLDLAAYVMDMVNKNLFEPNLANIVTDTLHVDTGKVIEAAEVMYGTRLVSHNIGQLISTSLVAMWPAHIARRCCVGTIESTIMSFNEQADRWLLNSTQLITSGETFVYFVSDIAKTIDEPLDHFFVMKLGWDDSAVRRVLENRMNKWLSFTDDIVIKMKSQLSKIDAWVFHVRGMPQNSGDNIGVITDQCEEHTRVDTPFDQIAQELLSFATDNIESFCLHDNYTYSFREHAVDDVHTKLRTLGDVIESMFRAVEYAIVINIRFNASRGSDDEKTNMMLTLNPGSLEHQCFDAFMVVGNVVSQFQTVYSASRYYQLWLEYMAATHR